MTNKPKLPQPKFSVRKTKRFNRWLISLDLPTRLRIAQRVDRVRYDGLRGDVKPVGEGVFEIRMDFGPGYRLYVVERDGQLVVLLIGGDKSTQKRDIAHAKAVAKKWSEMNDKARRNQN